MNTKVKPGQGAGKGASKTKNKPKGVNVKLTSDNYLCPIICTCNSGSKIFNLAGQELRQRCVSRRVAFDFEHGVQPIFLAEVGYDMTRRPPAPLMSAKNPHLPSKFPLGAAMRGRLSFDASWALEDIMAIGGSKFRIPDVIKIVTPGRPPIQSNIEEVIEIKFPGDTWRRGQESSYLLIAGLNATLKVMTPKTCSCKEPKGKYTKVPAMASSPSKSSVKDSQYRSTYDVKTSSQPTPSYAPATNYSVTSANNLSYENIMKGAKFVSGVVLVAGAIGITIYTFGAAGGAAGGLAVTGVMIINSN